MVYVRSFPFPLFLSHRLDMFLCVVCVLLFIGPYTVQAQKHLATSIRPIPPEASLRTGIMLIEREHYVDAVSILEPVVDAQPAYRSEAHGSAGFWLGQALWEMGKRDEARNVWAVSLGSILPANQTPFRLADRFVRSLTPSSLLEYPTVATDALWQLYANAGATEAAVDRSIWSRRVQEIARMLPDSVLSGIGMESGNRGRTFRPAMGKEVLRWWREQDPFLFSETNERFQEHVSRLVFAQTKYPCDDHSSGMDARGRVYLRYGPPSDKHVVDYDESVFFEEVVRFGVGVTMSDFPTNEFWLYGREGRAAYFLFAKNRSCFEIAGANDLLPEYLRANRPASQRSLNIAYSSMMALRDIYEELALLHPDFSSRYTKIADYVNWQETQGKIAQARDMTGGNSGELKSERREQMRNACLPARRSESILPIDLCPAWLNVLGWRTGLQPSVASRRFLCNGPC